MTVLEREKLNSRKNGITYIRSFFYRIQKNLNSYLYSTFRFQKERFKMIHNLKVQLHSLYKFYLKCDITAKSKFKSNNHCYWKSWKSDNLKVSNQEKQITYTNEMKEQQRNVQYCFYNIGKLTDIFTNCTFKFGYQESEIPTIKPIFLVQNL